MTAKEKLDEVYSVIIGHPIPEGLRGYNEKSIIEAMQEFSALKLEEYKQQIRKDLELMAINYDVKTTHDIGVKFGLGLAKKLIDKI